MVRLSALTFAGLAAAAASITGTHTTDPAQVPGNALARAFILECEGSQDLDALVKAVQDQGGDIRHQFNSKILRGLSVQLRNASITSSQMEQMPGVTKAWPVELARQPAELQPAEKPRKAGKQRRDGSASWNHIMTQVDRLHAAGFTGDGIRIAVVDSGVDYTHPALGGCFGEGCRVVLGDNFARGGNKNDPMDCNGHGTKVAGILAGSDANYRGVAPNATLAAYRVVDCAAEGVEDDLVAGWVRAYEDGAQLIVSSVGWQGSGWATGAAAVVVSRIVAGGVPCIVPLGNQKGAGLFSALTPASGKGVTAVNSLAPPEDGGGRGPGQDAEMAYFSTSGPTWDLDIKPTVGAPGQDVPAPEMGGGYTDAAAGTSFAAPLVGGIMALVAQVRASFDPALLNGLLVSTAAPQAPRGAPLSVAQQGGGLVRAWDAAHATTLVEPASLAFNDTQHRARSLSIRITNTAETNVTYHLDALAADTLYTLTADGAVKQSPPERASAEISISQRRLVVGPGESASVDISATDPTGLDVGRLPMWSGWISVKSDKSDVLTIPYLGLSGSLRDHRVLAPGQASLATAMVSNQGPVDIGLTEGQTIRYKTDSDGSLNLSLALSVTPEMGARLARAELVPVSPRKWLADRLQTKNLTLKTFTMEFLPHTETRRTAWNGQLEGGDYLPASTYKFAVRALRLFGDPDVESDWDRAETVTFKIDRGAGEKACRAYKAGKPPGGALFDSYQDCIEAHGDPRIVRRWVYAPEDQGACDAAGMTEKSCGTYRFCKAHDDEALSRGLKSPFADSHACVLSHRLRQVLPIDASRLSDCIATQDEELCGSGLWCDRFGSPDPFTNVEECKWAHGMW